MHISIKNLGIVRSAEIDLNGLTILTGNNDTGKSFIGKMIFSVIKTLKNAHLFYNEIRLMEIFSDFNKIMQAHRTIVNFDVERVVKFNSDSLKDEISRAFQQPKSKESILEKIEKFKNEIEKDISDYIDKNPTLSGNLIATNKEKIDDNFNIINLVINEELNDENVYKSYFNNEIIEYFFEGQINSYNGETLEVKFSEGSSTLLEMTIENNRVKKFVYNADNPIFKNDATIIDTPTVLILNHNYAPYRGNPYNIRPLPFHYVDLLSKIDEINGSPSPTISNPEVLEEIKNIIGGSAAYNYERRTFGFFRNGSDIQIDKSNLATGIKSFAILQLLLLSGNINTNSILIVDEPEVHLHPKWEIEYAKIIVELSKAGIPILVSSHSPYFLQAVVKYVKDNNTEDITRFYFGESEKEGINIVSKFKDVTDDLEPIFKALADPMRTIYFK
jgi:predicted ATPase